MTRSEAIQTMEEWAPHYAEMLGSEHYWWVEEYWPAGSVFFSVEDVDGDKALAFARKVHSTDKLPGYVSIAPADIDPFAWNVTITFHHAS